MKENSSRGRKAYEEYSLATGIVHYIRWKSCLANRLKVTRLKIES